MIIEGPYGEWYMTFDAIYLDSLFFFQIIDISQFDEQRLISSNCFCYLAIAQTKNNWKCSRIPQHFYVV